MGENKKEVKIDYIIKKYGTDLSKVDLSEYTVDLYFKDIRNIILPDDKEFFQKIKDRSLFGATMPESDYSQYNFDGVCIMSVLFTENSVLPQDRDFFQKLKDKSLYRVCLPTADYNRYNFEGIDIERTIFTINSILSKNKDFFQKIDCRCLTGTVMPKGDYRHYNFDRVNCSFTKFSFDSLLPEYSDFLQGISDNFYSESEEDYIISEDGFGLTRNMLKNIHKYDLSGITIDLKSYADYLTESQLSILRVKYKDELDKNIILPESGYLEERHDSRTKDTNRELVI